MRICKISPSSCKRLGRPCCKGCLDKLCPSRCRNDPARCGCVKEGPPPGGRPRKADPLKAAYLYNLGLSQTEIARKLSCSRSSVAMALREVIEQC